VVLGALVVVAGVAVYAIWVRMRAATGGGSSMQMTPAMAVAGVADGQSGAYASAAGFSAPSESSWAPVAPSMPVGGQPTEGPSQFEALAAQAAPPAFAPAAQGAAWPANSGAPAPQVEPAQQFAPQPVSAPAPDFEFIPEPVSAPPQAPQQAPAAEPAPSRIITAGGRIQVHCPACGAGNAVANRTCIMCGKKLPPVS
jgi:hypothetical protein